MRRIALSIAMASAVACNAPVRDVAPIRLDPMSSIGADTGAGMLATWPRVSARHPDGYRIVVPQPGGAPALPLVYGDDGSFLGVLGSPGDAPGEFREPLFVRFGPGDSLFVFDRAQRVVVFSPERVYARTIVLPVIPWDAVVMPDGRMVIASSVYDHPLPLMLVNANGEADRQIGAADSASMATPGPRRVVLGPDGTIWTMPMTGRWRLEHWSIDGQLLDAVERSPNWHPSRAVGEPGRPNQPHPSVQDIWFDQAGRLWIIGKGVDPAWEKGVADAAGLADTTPAIDDPDKVGDTIVEVYDVSTAQVVAEARFDDVYPFGVEPGIVMRVRTPGKGGHRAELARLVLDSTKLVGSR